MIYRREYCIHERGGEFYYYCDLQYLILLLYNKSYTDYTVRNYLTNNDIMIFSYFTIWKAMIIIMFGMPSGGAVRVSNDDNNNHKKKIDDTYYTQ